VINFAILYEEIVPYVKKKNLVAKIYIFVYSRKWYNMKSHFLVWLSLCITSRFHLFIYDLLNDDVTSSGYVVSNDWMISEWERMRKDVFVAYFKVLFQHFLGGTQKKDETSKSG
jgi:hypothetical protein